MFQSGQDKFHDEGECIKDLLPENYEYKIITYKIEEQTEQNIVFNVELRVNVKTEQETKVFLSDFNTSSGCTFNIQSGRQDRHQDGNNARSKYRGYRKCCMNVSTSHDKENRQPSKNTDCKACINFRLENSIAKCKTVKEVRESFPLWVKINFTHNHSLHRAEYFRYLSVSQETKNAYTEMFHQGLFPGAAHMEQRRLIKLEFPDTWHQVCADRSKLPSQFWVYSWHRRWLDKTVGSRDGIDAYMKAEAMVQEFDKECKQECPLSEGEFYAKIAQSPTGETVIAVVDPFMRRVHETIPQSGELVLIDATSNLDRNDSKLFHLVCPSAIGALPLGELITTREDTDTVAFGLVLLQSVLPEGAFYGRGRYVGPQVIMTDDSDAERNALTRAWPKPVLLLCIFHVLQAIWTWIWDAKHNIEHADKQTLLYVFRNVLYAQTPEDLSDMLEELYRNKTVLKYPQFQRHLIKDTIPKIQSWSLSRRNQDKLPTSGQNTNNLVKCSFRYTKDIQFNRLKAFNLPDMLSLVLDKSDFYRSKCVDGGNNVIENWLRNCHSRYVIKKPNIDPDKIVQIGPHSYLVPSETSEDTSYVVDMVTRSCSCPQGRLCGPCKHKFVVSHSRQVPSFDVIPSKHPTMRQLFMYLGTGKKVSIDWFLPLQEESTLTPSLGSQDHGSQNLGNQNQDSQTLDSQYPGTQNPSSQNPGSQNPGSQNQDSQNQDSQNLTSQNPVQSDNLKEKLQSILIKLGEKISSRIDHDPTGYTKAVNILEKTVDRLPLRVDSALQKSLCDFGKSVTQVGYKVDQHSK